MSKKGESDNTIKAYANKAVTQLQKMLEECKALKRKLKCAQLLEENDVGKITKSEENLNEKSDLCGLQYQPDSGVFHLTEKNEGELDRNVHERNGVKLINRNCAEGELCEMKPWSGEDSERLQEKLQNFETDIQKLQAQYKNTLKGLKSKDLIITELSDKILKATDKNNSLQNELSKMADGEIEFANSQKTLEKQLEKKQWEISELQSRILKDSQFKNNLLKDIEYYKNELKSKNERKQKDTSDTSTELSELHRRYEVVKVENETLFTKLKEINDIKETNQKKLNEKISECNDFQKEIENLKTDLTKVKIEVEILEAERNKISLQHNKVLKNVNATDKYLLTRESEDIKLKRQNSKLLSETNVYKMENQRLKKLLDIVEKTKKQLKMQNNELVGDNAKFVSERKTSLELLEQANKTISALQSQNEVLNQDLYNNVTRAKHVEGELKMCKIQNLQLGNDIKVSLAHKDEITNQIEHIKSENNELRTALEKLKIGTSKIMEDKYVESKISVHDIACQNSQKLRRRHIFEDKNLQTDALYEKICENCELIKRRRKTKSVDAIHHFEENFVREIVFEKSCENWRMQNVGANAHYESLLRKTSSLEEKFEYLENEFLKLNSKRYSNKTDDMYFSSPSVRNNGSIWSDLNPRLNSSKGKVIHELAEDLNGSQYNLQNIESRLNEEQEKLLTALRNLKNTKEKLYREKSRWDL